MSGQQRQRERGGGEQERRWKNASQSIRLCWRKTEKYRDRERGGNGTEVCDAAQTDWPSRNRGGGGASEGQQEPGSTERFSIRTGKLHNRVKSCSYTNIRRNKSLCQSHRRPKQETH